MAEADRQVTRRAAGALALASLFVALGLLAWHGGHVLLAAFGAGLFAILLDGLAEPLRRLLRLPRPAAVVAAAVVLAALFTLLVLTLGPALSEQVSALAERLPEAFARFQQTLARYPWGAFVLERTAAPDRVLPATADLLQRLSGVFSTALGAVTYSAFILIVGFYLALNPSVYLNGLLPLFPSASRDRAAAAVNAVGHALRWWLLGRLVAMAAVGVLTALGLWLIDIPLVLALGLIAGLFSFVPYIGPIVSAIPAVLLGLLEGTLPAFYVVAVYAFVQFVEGNFITPAIQVYAVSLPPAVLLTAQVLLGVLFGVLGVLLATPLAVAGIVLVQMYYVQGVLGEPVEVLGSRHHAG